MEKGLKVVPQTEAQKATSTIMDTIVITPDMVSSWELPAAQRQLKVNDKIRQLVDELKANGGVIPGVLTLGRIGGTTYLLDGQHRRQAFIMAEIPEGFADVRVHRFTNTAEMGREFVRLNQQLVRLTPDDILRGLEASSPPLEKIRRRCPYVGYDYIRRGPSSPIISMTAVLRAWFGSATDVPATGGVSSATLAETLTMDDADSIIEFLNIAYQAWGRDDAYRLLWRSLNMTIVMWTYRRTVITPYTPATTKLTKEIFSKCAMALSASSTYLDWLVGRLFSSRDRAPCYNRMKGVFAERYLQETGKKLRMPSPGWVHA